MLGATDLKLKTYLLRHPFVFNFKFVFKPMPWSDGMEPFFELLSEFDVENASDKEQALLIFAREDIRAYLRQLSPFRKTTWIPS